MKPGRIFDIILGISCVLNGDLIIYTVILQQKIKSLTIKEYSGEQQLQEWRDKLLDKVKEKIVLTEQSELKIKQSDDLVSKFIYQQDDIKQLGQELFSIYTTKVSALRVQFPGLTDLDMLVLCLLGIGMDNQEIATLLRMEKRTLYRRRQLMAMRIGISSMQLDEFAINTISED